MNNSDVQAEAHVTSNAVNRWCAYRIDMQAFIITSLFVFFVLFVVKIDSPETLAFVAVAL